MSRNYYRHLIGGDAPAPTGLFTNAVAYYKLDETSGQAIDVVNGYNGNLYGGVTQGVAGKIGNAYQFNGSTGYLIVPNNNVFTMTNGTDLKDVPFTIRTWINFNSLAENQWIINKRGDANNREYQLNLSNGDLEIILFKNNRNLVSTNSFIRGAINNISINTYQWYHLVVTYDGSKSAQGLTIYLNGVDATNFRQNSNNYPGMSNGNSNLIIGRAAWFSEFYFNGKLDEECIIKNEAWTPAQVAEDYNNGNGTTI